MEIKDLTEANEPTYCVCLEDWSDEMKEAGDHKCLWLEKMKSRGLGAKVAVEKDGTVVGMIQYMPIEYSVAEGEDLYFVDCIWVHGYEEGIGNHQGQGIGEALLTAAEEDVKARGAKGMAAWGLAVPIWMKASYYKKHGYRKADRDGIRSLVWKPFSEEAKPPKWIRKVKQPKANEHPGKVTVTVFYDGRCPNQNITLERAKKAASEFGDEVVFKVINTFEREVFKEWGISDGLFVEGKNMVKGPSPDYTDIRDYIAKKVKHLKK